MFNISVILLLVSCLISGKVMSAQNKNVRIATFNVSMEALNYLPYEKGVAPNVKGNELHEALLSKRQQIKNIAEIIQRVKPDIILLNEFDRTDDSHQDLKNFLTEYLAEGQKNQTGIIYPYFFQGPVNTGIKVTADLNKDGQSGILPADTHGFGYFEGHFAMALLSKYPIDVDNIRTFQKFKWQDMPQALKPINPENNEDWYSAQAWSQLRLSSKSHWDVPIMINQQIVHVLASHPTPPVFDGPENRNGNRNHDEIRFWHDYISADTSDYIYDDNKQYGGLKANQTFVILGDQNASTLDGDANKAGIGSLLAHKAIQDPMPSSLGGQQHTPKNPHSAHHTAHWRMRADYVLPSINGWKIINSGIFWPLPGDEAYRLIKDREASSDHRLVWLDALLISNDKNLN